MPDPFSPWAPPSNRSYTPSSPTGSGGQGPTVGTPVAGAQRDYMGASVTAGPRMPSMADLFQATPYGPHVEAMDPNSVVHGYQTPPQLGQSHWSGLGNAVAAPDAAVDQGFVSPSMLWQGGLGTGTFGRNWVPETAPDQFHGGR